MRINRIFRHVMFWGLPVLAVILLVLSGFVYWLIATPTGSRWAMNTVALQFDGESRGVKGSLWHGLEVEHVQLALPDQTRLEVDGAVVQVNWPRLWHNRQLYVQTLSAQRVAVWLDGDPKPTEPDAEPFTMPSLPVTVHVENLGVDAFYLWQQGQALPVDLSQLQLRAKAQLDQEGAQLQLLSARVGYEHLWVDTQVQAQLHELAAPWDSEATLKARVSTDTPEHLICLDQYLPPHLQDTTAVEWRDPEAPYCAVNLTAQWQGSLQQSILSLVAAGQGLEAEAQANLQLDQPFPLRDTTVRAVLPDQSHLQAHLDWQRDEQDPTRDRLVGQIQAQDFDVGAWLPDMQLPAKVTLKGDYQAQLGHSGTQLEQAQLQLQLEETSRWNGQVAQGRIHMDVAQALLDATVPLWQAYTIKNSDIDVRIGNNHLQLKGAFGLSDDTLQLLVKAPALKQLWPSLDQVGATEVEAKLVGSLFSHQLKAHLTHQLHGDPKAKIGNGPVEAQFTLKGNWEPNGAAPSWNGQLGQVQLHHAGLGAQIPQAASIEILLPTAQQPLDVDVGAFALHAAIDNTPWLTLQHQKTHVDATGFSTKGHTEALQLSAQRVTELMRRLGLENNNEKRGGVVDRRERLTALEDLSIQLDWDVALQEALAGKIQLRRLAGDLMVPAEPAFALGLEEAGVTVDITPGAGGRSVIRADGLVQTKDMGYIKVYGTSPIHYSKETGITLRTADKKELVVDAHIDNLAWTSLILKDQLELGGELIANVRLQSLTNGGFSTQGDILGHHLKVTRLDDGVRLLDGELKASLNDNRFTVERLHFPAQLRVEPKEWRTATWISENEDAKGGYLNLNGYWELDSNTGNFDVELYRYPLLQRADRYAMVTGDLHLHAVLPQINLSGKITADAGWFNLDMLGGIPTVDGDVVVIRSTDPVKTQDDQEAAPINMAMDLEVDLGPRFYLTGYGVNSGLIGQMRIHMIDGQITALGALNTRGGAIEMYGQRLQLRRGTITFQGDITSPILDIQALRTGLSVEAGVKVGGTARRPKIDLISIPEVSELEKLSWLLFGHGPDESSGDLALLLSVGSSFLGDGEPFYRKFGIDELSMRSGELGGAGTVLPANSTASSPESEVSEVERRFVEASKKLTDDITVSVRQALADTGTVGRATYRLSRRLTAEMSIGTVNGLALIYRWFSRD